MLQLTPTELNQIRNGDYSTSPLTQIFRHLLIFIFSTRRYQARMVNERGSPGLHMLRTLAEWPVAEIQTAKSFFGRTQMDMIPAAISVVVWISGRMEIFGLPRAITFKVRTR